MVCSYFPIYHQYRFLSDRLTPCFLCWIWITLTSPVSDDLSESFHWKSCVKPSRAPCRRTAWGCVPFWPLSETEAFEDPGPRPPNSASYWTIRSAKTPASGDVTAEPEAQRSLIETLSALGLFLSVDSWDPPSFKSFCPHFLHWFHFQL